MLEQSDIVTKGFMLGVLTRRPLCTRVGCDADGPTGVADKAAGAAGATGVKVFPLDSSCGRGI